MGRLTLKESGVNEIALNGNPLRTCDICKDENGIYKMHGYVADKLAAYEDTGLTPEEISTMKSSYSDTFQAHLNELLDIKDRRIAELEEKNSRLIEIVKENGNALKF